jgi:hypothetical protein
MASSTTEPPRRHHFLTQSWIKRFAADDGQLYVYDWEKDRVDKGSSKPIMMIYDLYTVEPGGILDTNTETGTLRVLDGAIPQILARLDGGERGNEIRRDLAWYFAAQAMRDPEVIASYAARSQAYALALVDALSAPSYADFMTELHGAFPGADVSQAEFDDMRRRGKAELETAIEHAIALLGAEGGTATSPFTDLLNDPSGRKRIEDQLLTLSWTLKTVSGARRFILGDHGLLFDKGGLAAGLRVPLSPTTALWLAPSPEVSIGIADDHAEEWEVDNLNAESAARARRWLAGEPSQLERCKRQVRGAKIPKA